MSSYGKKWLIYSNILRVRIVGNLNSSDMFAFQYLSANDVSPTSFHRSCKSLRRLTCITVYYELEGLLTRAQNLKSTAEFHIFGLNGTASHPDMLKILIIGYFFENKLYWQFEVWLLQFKLCNCF